MVKSDRELFFEKAQLFSMKLFQEKTVERHEQMLKYFETGEYTELDKFFSGIEPFDYDFEKKLILTKKNKKEKKKLEWLLNFGILSKEVFGYDEE